MDCQKVAAMLIQFNPLKNPQSNEDFKINGLQ
jgi:hypothetical protein